MSFDIQETKERPGLCCKKVIFSLGRLSVREHKGFNTVLKCMHRIKELVPNVLNVLADQMGNCCWSCVSTHY